MKAVISMTAALFTCCALRAAEPAGLGNPSADALRARIVETAKKYIGTMYRYGGKGEAGFDCSGFVQFVYRQNGIILPRTAAGQFNQGVRIDMASASPGDLVFFKIDGRRISHVGIFLNGLEFIHSPSAGKQITVARIDADYWRKRFAGVVTYIAETERKTAH
jgi:cell wall-associated NlpC family hydrolase